MRLPQELLNSPYFLFSSADELIAALGSRANSDEIEQIRHLAAKGLPPATSVEAIAVMVGLNSGLVWSFINRPRRHYNQFTIPKGKGRRTITAPRVGLKIVQKWLSVHLSAYYTPPPHVYGFVPGRSHVCAALAHTDAQWALSIDIRDFFQSTPEDMVTEAFHTLGYDLKPSRNLARLTTINGALAQGSPTSPVLSNICFQAKDEELAELARKHRCKISRYADDIVLSGRGEMPEGLRSEALALFGDGPWRIAEEKTLVQPLKGRIKINGFLVNGGTVRLTKGYRNKIRAYAHVLATKGDIATNREVMRGHVEYARSVGRLTNSPSGANPLELEGALSHWKASQSHSATAPVEATPELLPIVPSPPPSSTLPLEAERRSLFDRVKRWLKQHLAS